VGVPSAAFGPRVSSLNPLTVVLPPMKNLFWMGTSNVLCKGRTYPARPDTTKVFFLKTGKYQLDCPANLK
jgi:hypothetical protein